MKTDIDLNIEKAQVQVSFTKKRIGVLPLFCDGKGPADRRRLLALRSILEAAGNSIVFYYPPMDLSQFDVVVISEVSEACKILCDKQKSPGTRLVIDKTDSLFLDAGLHLRLVSRAMTKLRSFAWRQLRFKTRNWAISHLVKECEYIVVGSELQAQQIRGFNKKVSIIPDFVAHEYKISSNFVRKREEYTIVWEGFSENVLHFDIVIQALFELSQLFPITLKVITNDTINCYFKYAGAVSAYLARIPCKTEFIVWDAETVATHLGQGNVGIVPINMRNRFAAAKPANKVNIMRLLGLPVVASPTQAHCEAITDGLDGYLASNTGEWVEKITELFKNRTRAEQMSRVGQQKAQDSTSAVLIASKWLQIFNKIFHT